MKRSAVLLLLALFTVPPLASGQVSDTLPPTLDVTRSGFSPVQIDVSADAQIVTVTLRVVDDLSGTAFVWNPASRPGIVFRSPSGAQTQVAYDGSFSLVDGNELDGEWRAEVRFPKSAESGIWVVDSITLTDAVGNTARFDTALLTDMGFPTTLEVLSDPDTTPPVLVEFAITPDTIDTSTSDVNVTLRMRITDEKSGVDFTALPTYSWIAGTYTAVGNFIRTCGSPTLVSGDAFDGVWDVTCYFPKHSQVDDWRVYSVSLADAAGNVAYFSTIDLETLGFPTVIHLTSNPSDMTAPVLSAFSFSPSFIDTSGAGQTVTATAAVTDDLTGFSGLQGVFVSPSGAQQRIFYVWNLVSGTPLDGVLNSTVDFPRYSEAGTWRLNGIFYYDGVFNYRSLSAADLVARGFPTVLNVVKGSATEDGEVDGGGGTVKDDVYGDRASLTLPPGAVSGPTKVTIDVLESPLTFPMPTGFAAPGTRYVNITFDPEPVMPFPAPGATVVLPLVNPQIPGTPLWLYSVDPVSASLMPAIGVSGTPVVGTVNADGLSATFAGVAHFSVVVGLQKDTDPPAVTAPAPLTVAATEAGGARGSAAAALAAFLADGTAVDAADPAPVRLAPQVGGSDVTSATLFPIGATQVTFRFKDASGNIGTATSTVTVVVGRPRLSARVTGVTTPAAGVREVTIELTNTGNGHARDVRLVQTLLKTLSGAGTVTVASPPAPAVIGSLDAGASASVTLRVNVPATVTRFSITENGLLKDVRGTYFTISFAQSITP
jgi:hypothetical protein